VGFAHDPELRLAVGIPLMEFGHVLVLMRVDIDILWGVSDYDPRVLLVKVDTPGEESERDPVLPPKILLVPQ